MLELPLTTPAKATTSTRSLTVFFVAALVITWGLQFPGVLAQRGVIPGPVENYMPLVLLGIFGPTLAAIIATRIEGGSIRALFRGLRQWRVNPIWYVVAFAFQGALLALGMAIYSLVTGRQEPLLYFPDKQRLIAMVIISFAEEIGWRGFALPRLQQRFGPIEASLILGVLWAFWHIPMFMGANVPMSLLPLAVAFFIPGTLIYTWIYNRTGGSLLLMVFTHMGSHLNNSHLVLPGNETPFIVHTVMFWIAAIVIVLMDRTVRSRLPASEATHTAASAPAR